MTENFETTIQNNETQETLPKEFEELLQSKLFYRVESVVIKNIRIRDVFASFTSEFDCVKSFSPVEILYAADALITGNKLDLQPESLIVSFDMDGNADKELQSELLKRSVSGIQSLLALKCGVILDLDALGDKLRVCQTARYLILSEKRYKKLSARMQKAGVAYRIVGRVSVEPRIVFHKGETVLKSIDRAELENANVIPSLELGDAEFSAFKNGYYSACSQSLCDCVSKSNIIQLGEDTTLANICATVLGIYSTSSLRDSSPARIALFNNSLINVAVSRPTVSDGDYVYYLKLSNDAFGLPNPSHFRQLAFYLREMKKIGVIHGIFSYREDITRILNRLSNDTIEYVPLIQPEISHFGVFVTVGRGETINGEKIGYFKNR